MQKYFQEIPPFVYNDVPLGFWGVTGTKQHREIQVEGMDGRGQERYQKG